MIASDINKGAVAAATLALSRSKTLKVRQFAQHMIMAHTTIESQLASTLDGEHISLTPSALDAKLASDGAENVRTLTSAPASEFDRDYVSSQLKAHEAVLALLDGKLLPRVTDARLKEALHATRAKVVNHIRMARAVLATLVQ